MLRTVHILPLTIFVAALLLTVRLGDAWNRADGLITAGMPAQAAEGDADAADETPAAGEVAVKGLPGRDFTAQEIRVLEGLAERRRVLDRRESEIAMREGLLEAAENRIEAKIAEMEVIRQEVVGLVRQFDEQEEREINSLVKIYETMKPKDAARILQDLEMPVLMTIMERMKERATAPVLAAMNAGTARLVTIEMARRREIQTTEAPAPAPAAAAPAAPVPLPVPQAP